jgi:dihydroxyacetone kinase-like protein
MALTTNSLRAAIGGIGAKLEAEHQRLTALDAQLGDGDLGITLLKAFRALAELAPTLPDDLGLALLAAGSGVSKVSSSSFGTLMATALLAVAKDSKGKTEIAWTETARLVRLAREAMQARGKASLGDKTVLDSLAAIEAALAGVSDPTEQLTAARAAAAAALTAFREKPNRIGRARVYADRSIGIDDPGMAAVGVMLEGI